MSETIVNADVVNSNGKDNVALAARSRSALAPLESTARGSLLRMFADPHLLEKEERTDLVKSLRDCVAANPRVSDLRVVLGMALCVNFQVEDAIAELEEGVRLAPDSFIAQLKLGELWMRLRVCPKAESHTHQAALLARNHVQVELARKQAASIRTMKQAGIERGGHAFKSPAHLVDFFRRLWKRNPPEAESLATVEVR